LNSLFLLLNFELKEVRMKHNHDVHQETKAHVTSEDVANVEVYLGICDEVGEAKQVK